VKHKHLFTFCTAAVVAWALGTCAFIYFWPHMFYNAARRAIVESGLGIKAGGIPVNTLYAMSALASPSLSKSAWVRTGNRDTLYTVGVCLISAKDRRFCMFRTWLADTTA
jgi:hypothetical protein